MALRPVFIPVYHGPRLVEELPVVHPLGLGFFGDAKEKECRVFAPRRPREWAQTHFRDFVKIGEKVGRRLSAFSLKIDIGTTQYPWRVCTKAARCLGIMGRPRIFLPSRRERRSGTCGLETAIRSWDFASRGNSIRRPEKCLL